MKIDFLKLWKGLLNPPTWAKILTFVVTILSATLSLIMVFLGFENSSISILCYILFAIAGVSLFYSVYLIIPLIPKLKRKIIKVMENRRFTNLILHDFEFRTLVFAISAFSTSLLISGFNAYMGIVNRSIWYGALAGFYISLALLRGGVLFYRKKIISKEKRDENSLLLKAKMFRNSGVIMLFLNVALSSAIAQMIFSNAHFTYIGLTVFAFAAYAFYKITISVISFIKAHRQFDLIIKVIRNINLVDAMVSILALQTALLTMFNDGSVNVSAMNTLTGIVVSVFSIGIGVYMIVSANKIIKNLPKENKNNE